MMQAADDIADSRVRRKQEIDVKHNKSSSYIKNVPCMKILRVMTKPTTRFATASSNNGKIKNLKIRSIAENGVYVFS